MHLFGKSWRGPVEAVRQLKDHLDRLEAGGEVVAVRQGRHRFSSPRDLF
jgi:hypothetical protein